MVDIILTDTNPTVVKATGGGSTTSATATEANPTITKAVGGGGRELVSLLDYSPVFGGNQGRAGFNPVFEALL